MDQPRHPTWAPPQAPAQLVVDGAAACPAWVARRRDERNTGLLGTSGLDGALWIERCGSVHTFAMRYPIDVVLLTRSGRVRDVLTMVPRRAMWPRLTIRSVVELPAGRAAALGIARGSVLSVSGD